MERTEAKIILDLGIGQGGEYISKDPSNTIRFGLDLQIHQSLLYQKRRLNNLIVLNGTAQQLPLRDETIDEIQIYFPYTTLLSPGLQSPDNPQATWYKEFSRVLKTGGKLTIWADHLLLIKDANNGANPYFDSSKEEYLFQNDLISLRTSTALRLAEPHDQNMSYPLGYKIEMKKRVPNPVLSASC